MYTNNLGLIYDAFGVINRNEISSEALSNYLSNQNNTNRANTETETPAMRALTTFQSLNPSSSFSSSSISHSLFSRTCSPLTLSAHPQNHHNNKSIHYSRFLSHKSPISVPQSQNRPDNSVSEDTDDMFDELLDKYGKVVYSSKNDVKRPAAEVDDDAESLSFAVALAKVASEVKAADIRVLFVKPLVYWTRFFIIATAFSRPQIDAIGSKIRDLAEEKFKRVSKGDTKPNSWTLLDFGDVVVHIFLPQQRAFYNLEEFYGNATPIELPFENQNQSPFRS